MDWVPDEYWDRTVWAQWVKKRWEGSLEYHAVPNDPELSQLLLVTIIECTVKYQSAEY